LHVYKTPSPTLPLVRGREFPLLTRRGLGGGC